MPVSEQTLDRWIAEDVPYFDLTTHLLGIGGQRGGISYACRHPATVACTEEAARILTRQGIRVDVCLPSGTQTKEGEVFLSGEGPVESLHAAWKVAQNLLEYACGIATRTQKLVGAARAANPDISVLTTRKSFSGTKEISVRSVLAGGAMPHRLGLGETVLIFDNHLRYMGGYDGLLRQFPRLKKAACDKPICVEVDTLDHALALVRAGVDALQFDKLPPEQMAEWVKAIRAAKAGVLLIAAGGVNAENAAAYAAAGVDAISTTWVYFGKPADIKVTFA